MILGSEPHCDVVDWEGVRGGKAVRRTTIAFWLLAAPALAEHTHSWFSCQYVPLAEKRRIPLESAAVFSNADAWVRFLEGGGIKARKSPETLSSKLTSLTAYLAGCEMNIHLGKKMTNDDRSQPLTLEINLKPHERKNFEDFLKLMNIGLAFMMKVRPQLAKPPFEFQLERPQFTDNSPGVRLFTSDVKAAVQLLRVMQELQEQFPKQSDLLAAQSPLFGDLILRITNYQIDQMVEQARRRSPALPFQTRKPGWQETSAETSLKRIYGYDQNLQSGPDAGLLGRIDSDGRQYNPHDDSFVRTMVESFGGSIPPRQNP